MDKVIYIPSAGLGLCFIAVYLYRCHSAGKDISLSIMVNAILQASGIVCGIFLIASTIFQEVRKLLQGIEIYVFIAGLAVIAVSLQGFHRDVIKMTKPKK